MSDTLKRSRRWWARAVRDESRFTPENARYRYRQKLASWRLATLQGVVSSQTFGEADEAVVHRARGVAYRFDIALVKEEDGAYSAIVLNLPGAGSCGGTPEEAVANARESISGLLASYRSDGAEVPWVAPDEYDIPDGATVRPILVNV